MPLGLDFLITYFDFVLRRNGDKICGRGTWFESAKTPVRH